MKISHVKIPFSLSLVIGLFLMGCSRRSNAIQILVPTSHLTEASLDTGKALTLLKILATYPAKQNCTDSAKYSNLYICKQFTTGDTVYVFEECAEVQKYALDTSYHYAAVVSKTNIRNRWPNKFIILHLLYLGFRIMQNVISQNWII
jgi:hypothetical protein